MFRDTIMAVPDCPEVDTIGGSEQSLAGASALASSTCRIKHYL